jgi:hypothetical protein
MSLQGKKQTLMTVGCSHGDGAIPFSAIGKQAELQELNGCANSSQLQTEQPLHQDGFI